jgi:hypothetical protein
MYNMANKGELVQLIKDWMTTDNEIRTINKELRARKERLKKVSEDLMKTMKENEIDEFNTKDGTLIYSKTNIKKPITKKSLATILSKYYNGDTTQAVEMNNFIMKNRDEGVKEIIKCKPIKTTKS